MRRSPNWMPSRRSRSARPCRRTTAGRRSRRSATRPAIRAARQRREDPPRARGSPRRRSLGWHDEDSAGSAASRRPCALNGPWIVIDCTWGAPSASNGFAKSRMKRCRRLVSNSGDVFSRNAAATSRWPALTKRRTRSRVASMLSDVSVGFVCSAIRSFVAADAARSRIAFAVERAARPPADPRGRASRSGSCDRAGPGTRTRRRPETCASARIPPTVPSGSPSRCTSCDRSCRTV